MAFIIKRARQKGNGMIACHHPSFYSLPSTPFSRPSISLYLLWPDRCLPLSPLHLPLQTPGSSRDLLLSGERVPAVNYVQGSGGLRLQGKECAANVNAAYGTQSATRPGGWGLAVGGGGGARGDHEHTVMCCSQPYTRPSCSPCVEPVGIQFINNQIRFVAATEEKCQKWTFQHLWCSIHLTSTVCGLTFSSWMWDGNEPSRPTFLSVSTSPSVSHASTSCSRTSFLPPALPSHRLRLPPLRLSIDLSVCKKARTAYLSLCAYFVPSCLLPLPHLLLINFILWLPGALPLPGLSLLPSLPSSTLCPPFSCRLPSIFL